MDAYSATRDASVDDRLCALRPKGVFDILWSDSGLRAQNLLCSPLGCSSAQQRTKRVCSVEYVVNKTNQMDFYFCLIVVNKHEPDGISIFVESNLIFRKLAHGCHVNYRDCDAGRVHLRPRLRWRPHRVRYQGKRNTGLFQGCFMCGV